MSASKEDRPATQAERDAVTFEAIDLSFDWTNQDWALTYLPPVRVASVLLAEDSAGIQEMMARVVKSGAAPDMLEGMCVTKEHLKALTEMLERPLAVRLSYWNALATTRRTRHLTMWYRFTD